MPIMRPQPPANTSPPMAFPRLTRLRYMEEIAILRNKASYCSTEGSLLGLGVGGGGEYHLGP